jgi:hypothetical protein
LLLEEAAVADKDVQEFVVKLRRGPYSVLKLLAVSRKTTMQALVTQAVEQFLRGGNVEPQKTAPVSELAFVQEEIARLVKLADEQRPPAKSRQIVTT